MKSEREGDEATAACGHWVVLWSRVHLQRWRVTKLEKNSTECCKPDEANKSHKKPKKVAVLSHYCPYNQLLIFLFKKHVFPLDLTETFLRLRKSVSPAPHALLLEAQAFHSCGRAMPGPDLATCMVLWQLMKQALRLLLPAFVLSYKLPYKESYCYKAGKWLVFSEPLLCLICFRFLQSLPSFSIPFLFFFFFPKDINQSYDWNGTAKKNNLGLIFSIT